MIDNYQFGKITINGRLYQKDLIIFPDQILSNWRREQGHLLHIYDLKIVISKQPKTIIIGTGMFGRMRVPQQTRIYLESAGIEVIVHKTNLACQVFNQRKAEGHIIAALHLTC